MLNYLTNFKMEDIHGTRITASVFDEMAMEEGYEPYTKILKYTLSNGDIEVDIIEYGAIITAIRVPDRDGTLTDIVCGYDDIKGYMATENNPYFGATIGRVTNRIAHGKFVLDDVTYFLSKNEGDNTLHGGVHGFNRKLWKGCAEKEGLILKIVSPHLDQGFPGQLHVEAKFTLTKDNHLIITYSAKSNMPTIVNMTNHSYFNLAGHNAGAEKLYEHNLMINAFHFTPTDDDNIPKGKIQDVLDTVLDFSRPKNVGEAIEGTAGGNGFDINFCLNGLPSEMKLVAVLEHGPSGRKMTMKSNQPGVQLYTANCTQVKDGKGKEGTGYSRHSALCLETQNYPNAINQKNFPSCVLRPPGEYVHVVSYHFTTFDVSPTDEIKHDSIIKSVDAQDTTDTDAEQPDSSNLDARDQIDADTTKWNKSSDTVTKSVKLDCQKNVDPRNDPTLCLVAQFPDFRQCPKPIDPLNYEPLSSVYPLEGCKCELEEFNSLLTECKDLLKSSGLSYQVGGFNILKDTDVRPDWVLPERVDKETETDDSRMNITHDESKAQLEIMKSLSKQQSLKSTGNMSKARGDTR